jgi:uncharacterized membrane protein YdbT with pleckstrin-like domain
MFCRKCGKENADDAVYCQRCGNVLEPEEETRVARRGASEKPAEGGSPIFSVSPTLLFVKAGYVLAAIGAFVLVALISVFLSNTVSIIAGVIAGMALLLIPAFYHLRHKLVRYSLTDTTVEIDTGLISRTTQNIPLRRIQDVTVAATVPQRLLGFGDIVIDNAGEDGGKIVLKNINSPRKYADILLKQMGRLDRDGI